MGDRPNRSPIRKLLLIAAIGVPFVLVILVGFGLVYHSATMPSATVFDGNDKRYRETRAFFSDAITTATAPVQAAPVSITVQTTESLQARCDRLFVELLIPLDTLPFENRSTIIQPKMKAAIELAGMYDLGVRVSPAAKAHYNRYQHEGYIGLLAEAIAFPGNKGRDVFSDSNPATRAQKFANVVKGLKFLAVVDCAYWPNNSISALFAGILVPWDRKLKDTVPELPTEIRTLDLSLIAPQRPVDWNRQLAGYLEYQHDRTAWVRGMVDPRNAYQRRLNMVLRSRQGSMPWYLVPIWYGDAALEAATAYMRGPKTCQRILDEELKLQEYAASIKQTPIPITPDLTSVFSDLRPRFIAGGLALRRGEPLPRPEQIGPSSYFFDPVMQRPFKFYIEKKPGGVVQLQLCRPMSSGGHIFDNPAFRINLPAGHPGLENVPERP